MEVEGMKWLVRVCEGMGEGLAIDGWIDGE